MGDDQKTKWYKIPSKQFSKIRIKKSINKVENATVKHAHKFIIKRWDSVLEVQRHIIFWILTVGLLIAATAMQLVWYQDSYRVSAKSKDGTYAEAVLGPVETLNPLFASTSAEQSLSTLLFSKIMKYDSSGKLNYDLASDFRVDYTSKVYTVKLRSDVKWHDNEKLTAHDIAFTVDLMQNPATRSMIGGWEGVRVDVVNDYEIKFTLPNVYAAFNHALTFPILPKHILKDVLPGNLRENIFSNEPVGSGPFKLKLVQVVNSSLNREVIYLIRNDDYYAGKANLARFQLHVYDSREAIISAVSQNEVNAATDLSLVDIDQIDMKKYSILSKPIDSGVYAILNVRSLELKDVNVRNALRLATDTNAVIADLSDGVKPLYLPFIGGDNYTNTVKAPTFSIEQAEILLDKAGWKINKSGMRQKNGVDLKISAVTLKDNELERVLENLAGQWRSLGITVDTKIVDVNDVSQNVAQSILRPRNYDVLLYRLNLGVDQDVYAYWHSSQVSDQGSNFANYSSLISDDALLAARSKLDSRLREAKYITFARQWLSDVPAIGLYQSTMQYAYNTKIHSLDGQTELVSSIDRYSDLLDWSVGKRSVYKTP